MPTSRNSRCLLTTNALLRPGGETLGVSWASVQHNAAQQVWTPQQGLQAVELVWSAIEPRFESWWSGGRLGSKRS